MKMCFVRCAALVACALPATFAQAVDINGVFEALRVFNDFPTSTASIVDSYPGSIVIDDRNLPPRDLGGGANRHDVLLSSDGGATAHTFDIDDGFTVKGVFKLDVGSAAPRKEAGIRVNSPVTGDALFIINSDAGEIVAFGGGAEFYSFSGGPQPDYVPGTEILLGYTYSGGTSSPRTVQYFIDRDPSTPDGIESSPALVWSNLENGPTVYNVAFYGQVTPANTSDFITVTITNPMFTSIPEPASLVLVALSMLGCAGFVRRRS